MSLSTLPLQFVLTSCFLNNMLEFVLALFVLEIRINYKGRGQLLAITARVQGVSSRIRQTSYSMCSRLRDHFLYENVKNSIFVSLTSPHTVPLAEKEFSDFFCQSLNVSWICKVVKLCIRRDSREIFCVFFFCISA